MKELLRVLLEQLKATTASVRAVIAAGVALIALVTGYAVYQASHPHMVFLAGSLDNSEFSAVTAALGAARIRFDTSTGGEPYTVFVEQDRKYDARNAIALDGALAAGPRGIDTTSRISSVFKSSGERRQEMNVRFWGEVEMQLERLTWVAAATVTASPTRRSALGREDPVQVAVVLRTRGVVTLDATQRRTVATLVKHAFGVPEDHIVITDQYGNALFDGEGNRGLDAMLAFEQAFGENETKRAQKMLDLSFGGGMTVVSVKGEWNYERKESVDERIDPTKLIVSETTMDTSTPSGDSWAYPGGPAGVTSNTALSGPPNTPANDPDPATTTEAFKKYDYSTTTTHITQDKPVLKRLSITLLVDESISSQLSQASDFVKHLVGYDDTRDLFEASALELASVTRDSDGNPIAPEPQPIPEAPSATVTLLLERGVEILAATAFLLLLARSLRKGTSPIVAEADTDTPDAASAEDEDVDLDLLARKRAEEILKQEPERVGALLSRWAVGETSKSEVGKAEVG